MKKLEHLWKAIEDIPGLLAIRAAWRNASRADFGLIAASLQPTAKFSGTYPCPYPNGHSCPRRIVNYGDDEVAAICQDPHRICPDLSLSVKDALLYELDLFGFIKPVLEAAGVRNPQLALRTHGVWNVGLAIAGDLSFQPAYLLVLSETEAFDRAAQSLMFEIEGAFTIIAPTERHWTGTLQERMRPPRINFIPLNERIGFDDGRFVAVQPMASTDDPRPTPVDQRKELIEQFLRQNGNCAIKQICYWAKVTREDLNKWKNGRPAVSDRSVKAIRIEKLLQFGIRSRD